jgi:hypothetical protein
MVGARGIAICSCVALCLACEEDRPSPNDNAPNSTIDGGAASADRDAGVEDIRDLGVPDADFTGSIYVFSRAYNTDAGPFAAYAATAGFAESPSEVCSTRTPAGAGAECRSIECVPRTPEGLDGGVRPTAGDIQINGGADRIYLFVGPGFQYQAWTIGGYEYFQGGETLSAVASGASIPSFTLEVVAPERAIVTEPAIPGAGQSLEVQRNRPLELAWSGATRGTMKVSLSVLAIDKRTSIECHYPAPSGSATISASLLATLPTGDGFYELRVENVAETTAGEYSVSFTAASNVVDGAARWARGPLTIR